MYDLGPALDGETVPPGSNILLSGPPLTGKRRLGLEILAHGAASGAGSVVVTTRDAADRILADFGTLVEDIDRIPLGIVDCVSNHQGQSTSDSDRVTYTSSPVDMTGIGINFSGFIDKFRTDQGLAETRVLLDSLTTLLYYSKLQTVFRFLHVFTSRVENAEALGVHVIDATAHDDQTLNTLKQLFDGVVSTDDEGVISTQLPGSA